MDFTIDTGESCITKTSPTDDIIFSPVEIDQLVSELDKIGVEGSDSLFEDILKNLKGEGILD
ncbi:hypothetical protein PHLCEN_2v8048 [Hermanssonia centrifuga]|uniref:Uncharacterized protein n=1 Tax=Hermanssonia centrifuga TaxID=98765 RepID=A0A2R6NUT6_9APHY|nr:hypothetical protein PHLCEN_2v8048 [Hermanssonia centrifuga]